MFAFNEKLAKSWQKIKKEPYCVNSRVPKPCYYNVFEDYASGFSFASLRPYFLYIGVFQCSMLLQTLM